MAVHPLTCSTKGVRPRPVSLASADSSSRAVMVTSSWPGPLYCWARTCTHHYTLYSTVLHCTVLYCTVQCPHQDGLHPRQGRHHLGPVRRGPAPAARAAEAGHPAAAGPQPRGHGVVRVGGQGEGGREVGQRLVFTLSMGDILS